MSKKLYKNILLNKKPTGSGKGGTYFGQQVVEKFYNAFSIEIIDEIFRFLKSNNSFDN